VGLEGFGPKWAASNERIPEHGGRPPGVTAIVDDEQLRAPISEMRRDRRRITQATVAAYSGFTLWEIRGYMKITNRKWSEFLLSF
jgi:hypothetical protein